MTVVAMSVPVAVLRAEPITKRMRAVVPLARTATWAFVERVEGRPTRILGTDLDVDARISVHATAAALAHEHGLTYSGPALCTYCALQVCTVEGRWCSDAHARLDRSSEITVWRRSVA